VGRVLEVGVACGAFPLCAGVGLSVEEGCSLVHFAGPSRGRIWRGGVL